MTGDLLRHAAAFLCTLAFAGLLWRLIGRWRLSTSLAHWVCGLLAVLELLVALGTARGAAQDHPLNEVTYLIVVHALVTLAVVALWPRLLPATHPAHARR